MRLIPTKQLPSPQLTHREKSKIISNKHNRLAHLIITCKRNWNQTAQRTTYLELDFHWQIILIQLINSQSHLLGICYQHSEASRATFRAYSPAELKVSPVTLHCPRQGAHGGQGESLTGLLATYTNKSNPPDWERFYSGWQLQSLSSYGEWKNAAKISYYIK